MMLIKIDDNAINDIVRDDIPKTIERAKHAHYTNIYFRINGKDEFVEADWIKYARIVEDWSCLYYRIKELKARLKMYEDWDAAPDDTDWQPPHPIFLLAQERDHFMEAYRNESALVDKAIKKNTALQSTLDAVAAYAKELQDEPDVTACFYGKQLQAILEKGG